jgi:hypothetical protein
MIRLMTLPLAIACLALNALAWNFEDISSSLTNCPANASCVAWGDLNSDGHEDLFVGGHNGSESALYLSSSNGSFINITADANLTGIIDVKSAQFVDFNADGHLDLLCLLSAAPRIQLFAGSYTDRFEPVDLEIDAEGPPITNAAWMDFNHDSDLDLMISNGAAQTLTVLEQNASVFVAARGYELPNPGYAVGSMNLLDINGDGNLDLFIGARRRSETSRLYIAADGRWCDWTERFRLPKQLGQIATCWADFNGDGLIDLFSPGDRGENHLLMQYPSAPLFNFRETTIQSWIGPLSEPTISACAADADMDGNQDLCVVRRIGNGIGLLHNGGNAERWSDVAPSMGIDNRAALNNGAAWGDCDGDGDKDLAIAQEGTGVKLYRNNVEHRHEYVVVHLCGANHDTPLANCRVRFDFEFDKDYGSTMGTSSSNCGNGAAVTLVNGASLKSSTLNCQVTWPSGLVTTYSYEQLLLNKHNWLHEPTENPERQQFAPPTRVDLPRIIGNAPNPFNPSTQVTFNLPTAGQVQLTVFDLMGRNVATLADGVFAAGEHTLNFNAGALPSGTYLVRLTSPQTSVVHRMMLLK